MSPSWASVGPLSYQGAPPPKTISDVDVPNLNFNVVNAEPWQGLQGYAYVHPQSIQPWISALTQPAFVCLAAGSDCVLSLRTDERVAEGCLSLDRVQQRNLRVAPGNVYSFSLFRPREAETEPLVELLAEVRRVRNLGFENDDGLLTNASPADASNCQTIGSGSNIDGISSKLNHLNIACGSSNRCEQLDNSESAQPTEARDMGSGKCAPVTVDGREVERELMRCWLGRYITVNQLVPLQVHGLQLLVWVAATHTLPLEDREQTLGYHCFRGTLTPLTTVYLKQTDVAVLNQSGRPHNSEAQKSSRVQSHLTLVNTRQPPLPGESPHIIAVHTNDGEEFRVARTLLRPCISLTRALRDAETSALSIDVDTATFDRWPNDLTLTVTLLSPSSLVTCVVTLVIALLSNEKCMVFSPRNCLLFKGKVVLTRKKSFVNRRQIQQKPSSPKRKAHMS